MELIQECQRVFDIEISELQKVRNALDSSRIVDVINQIYNCNGKIVFCGIGKAGHVARKAASTFSSLGIASFFLHPTEGLHGDLGSLNKNDIILLISNSGNTEELLKLFPTLKFIGTKIIAVTSNQESELALHSDLVLCLPKAREACVLELAPTSSTTVEMVICDALAIVVSRIREFKEDFARFHPEGVLGSTLLTRVRDIMRTGQDIPIVRTGLPLKDVIVEMSQKGMGAAIIVNASETMRGIVTDGDLRRAMEKNIDIYFCTVDDIMTTNPIFVREDILAVDALKLMEEGTRSVSVLPVLDDTDTLKGIIHAYDIIRRGIMI